MTTTSHSTRSVEEQPHQANSESIFQVTTALFVVGCVLLICCALAITHLGDWADDYGQIRVFVVFFIVMSLAGRWFWAGADAAITWSKSRR